MGERRKKLNWQELQEFAKRQLEPKPSNDVIDAEVVTPVEPNQIPVVTSGDQPQ